MEPDDTRVVFSALAQLDHSALKMSTYEDAITMSQVVRADLEPKVARQLRDVELMARDMGIPSDVLLEFLLTLLRDESTRERLLVWRAARRLTE